MLSEIFLSLLLIVSCLHEIVYCVSQVEPKNGTIFYFAYGSNLLAKRIHYKNPSAVYYGTAELKNHRLDFNMFSDMWKGAVSTIVPDNEEDVWGAVWNINIDEVQNLDEQEGVNIGWYFPKNVTLTTPDGQQLVARTYQETQIPDKTKKNEDLPMERRPSNTYLQVIALGAIESQLPAEYIGFLFSFPTNRNQAQREIRDWLGYPF